MLLLHLFVLVIKVTLVLKDHKVLKVMLVHKDHRVQLVPQVLLDHLVLLVHLVQWLQFLIQLALSLQRMEQPMFIH